MMSKKKVDFSFCWVLVSKYLELEVIANTDRVSKFDEDYGNFLFENPKIIAVNIRQCHPQLMPLYDKLFKYSPTEHVELVNLSIAVHFVKKHSMKPKFEEVDFDEFFVEELIAYKNVPLFYYFIDYILDYFNCHVKDLVFKGNGHFCEEDDDDALNTIFDYLCEGTAHYEVTDHIGVYYIKDVVDYLFDIKKYPLISDEWETISYKSWIVRTLHDKNYSVFNMLLKKYFQITDFNIFEKAQIIIELIFHSATEQQVKDHYKSLETAMKGFVTLIETSKTANGPDLTSNLMFENIDISYLFCKGYRKHLETYAYKHVLLPSMMFLQTNDDWDTSTNSIPYELTCRIVGAIWSKPDAEKKIPDEPTALPRKGFGEYFWKEILTTFGQLDFRGIL